MEFAFNKINELQPGFLKILTFYGTIINGQRQGISKGRACFVKRNAMDFEVFCRLVRVPFKQKHSSYPKSFIIPLPPLFDNQSGFISFPSCTWERK